MFKTIGSLKLISYENNNYGQEEVKESSISNIKPQPENSQNLTEDKDLALAIEKSISTAFKEEKID